MSDHSPSYEHLIERMTDLVARSRRNVALSRELVVRMRTTTAESRALRAELKAQLPAMPDREVDLEPPTEPR